MEAIAGHPNVALLIAIVAFYVVLGVVEALRAPRKPKSRPRPPEGAVERGGVCGGATLSLGRAGRNGTRNRAGKAMRIAS